MGQKRAVTLAASSARSSCARHARHVLAALAALSTLVLACTTGSSKAGAGAECFLASDCEDGLVCVPQPNGGRVCSSDISRVAGQGPMEAGAGDAARDAPLADAPVNDAPSDTSPQDTGTDTGAADAGTG